MRKIGIEVPEKYCNDCVYFINSEPIGETGDYSDSECILFPKKFDDWTDYMGDKIEPCQSCIEATVKE